MIIPPGFGTVAPYLFVKHAGDYVSFLIKAFECEEVGRSSRPDGKIANCQVRFGSATIMLSESGEKYPPTHSSFYLYVDNAELAMQRALDNGATLEMAVMDMAYGDRQGGVTDPAGNTWWISQRLTTEGYYS